jgi:hypothetical protein|tara:strand:+ start:440 stop:574 length:135 start_codon:yes stop_codon:yes gene_type:complete
MTKLKSDRRGLDFGCGHGLALAEMLNANSCDVDVQAWAGTSAFR